MAEDERIIDPSPLNERQESLLKQVKAGKITEDEPDTEAQLLTLARQGHADMESDEDGYHFTVPKGSAKKKAEAE